MNFYYFCLEMLTFGKGTWESYYTNLVKAINSLLKGNQFYSCIGLKKIIKKRHKSR